MGQPTTRYGVVRKREPGELKHLSSPRKRKQIVILLVAVSERGTA
jgi:hypothetical protein